MVKETLYEILNNIRKFLLFLKRCPQVGFHKAYRDMKQEQGIMDFSDLEHLCLALLVEPGTEDDPQPSEVAKELQDTFKEIYETLGYTDIHVSISHCKEYAMSTVILEGA